MQFLEGQQALHLGVRAQRLRPTSTSTISTGKLITPLTTHTTFEVGAIVKVDEAAGVLFYTARDGDNHMKLQLHRVGLDGKGDVRLTDPAFHHTVAPACGAAARRRALRVRPAASRPTTSTSSTSTRRTTRRRRRAWSMRHGKVVAELAKSDLTKFDELGLKKAEMFTYKAADGKTTLHGLIQFPSNFDPSKKYPVLVPRVRRPGVGQQHARETFVDAERDHRVRLPRRQPRLARRARAWASGRSTRST